MSRGLLVKEEETELAIDGFTFSTWAFDVFEWLCEPDGREEQWRCSPVNGTRRCWLWLATKEQAKAFCKARHK